MKFFDFSGNFENQWFSDSDFYLKKLELMVWLLQWLLSFGLFLSFFWVVVCA